MRTLTSITFSTAVFQNKIRTTAFRVDLNTKFNQNCHVVWDETIRYDFLIIRLFHALCVHNA